MPNTPASAALENPWRSSQTLPGHRPVLRDLLADFEKSLILAALTAAGVLLLAGGWTAAARGDSFAGTMIGLALLGLGWNLGLVAGTALIVDGTTPAERPHTQGMIDVLVALAGAGAGASSGLVASAFGYPILSIGSGLIGLALLPLIVAGSATEAQRRQFATLWQERVGSIVTGEPSRFLDIRAGHA